MTSEEIKDSVKMSDVLAMYGLKTNRAGFCNCPFHQGDRTASMKIYDDNFHCFGCGADGDIFTFVMKMDNTGFKEAFLTLGGEYPHNSRGKISARFKRYHARKKREAEEARKRKEKEYIRLIGNLIDIYRKALWNAKPMSEDWTFAYNELQKKLNLYDHLTGIDPVSGKDIVL